MVVSGTIFLSICATTTFGGLLPILFKKLGQDPALMSNSMLTTIADVISAGIYFLMARTVFG
jgi:magnesium transporter